MKDEIKEILDDLRKTADNTIFAICSSQEELDKMPRYTANFMSINDRKAKLLLDYITNLQTIEHQYSALLSENAELENRIKELETINEEHRRINGELRKTINEAIEYIKNKTKNEVAFDNDKLIDVLNILQGSDE